MKLTPVLYVVTTESELNHKRVLPTVRCATTCHWWARVVRWWHGGTLSHDMLALSQYGQPFEDQL